MSSRNMCLLPLATLHSDSEQLEFLSPKKFTVASQLPKVHLSIFFYSIAVFAIRGSIYQKMPYHNDCPSKKYRTLFKTSVA